MANFWPQPLATTNCAALPGQLVVIQPDTSFSWGAPTPGCAPTQIGYTYTVTLGATPEPEGDDGAAGVREPVRR